MARTGPSRRSRNVFAAGLFCVVSLASGWARASSHILDNDPNIPTFSNYGGVGLLDMRNARFMPDGYFNFGFSKTKTDDRYALTFQATPWMEFTFRYTNNRAIIGSDGTTLFDRSFDLKIRLKEEEKYWPALAIGLQDFLGTGVYSGEYIVASKRFGDVDVTGGVGWGRLASSGTLPNPFALVSDRFKTRNVDFGQGGVPLFSTYFHGPDIGLFGGIEYRTPIRDLSLKIEYSSDRYTQEELLSGRDYSFPVNFGLNYRIWPGFDLGVSLMHGNEVGVSLHGFFDPAEDTSLQRSDPPPPITVRDPAEVAEFRKLRMQQATERPGAMRFVDLSQKSADATLQWQPTSDGVMLMRATGAPIAQAPAPVADIGPGGIRIIDLAKQPERKSRLVWKDTPLGVMLVDESQTGPNVAAVQPAPAAAPPVPASPLADASSEPLRFAAMPAPSKPVRLAEAFLPGEGKIVTDTGVRFFGYQSEVAADDSGGAPDGDEAMEIAAMSDAIVAQSLLVDGVRIHGGQVNVIVENMRYRRDAEAIARTARALSASAPARIDTFSITTARAGLLLTTVTVQRSDLEGLRLNGQPAVFWQSASLEPAKLDLSDDLDGGYPKFDMHYLYPTFSQGLFDPDNPFYFRFGVGANGTVNLTRGLAIEAAGDAAVYDTFSGITRASNSVLPHVRTDVAEYLKDGKYGIRNLQGSYTFQVAPEVYARAAAGYLEDMYAGVGGEILYRPFGQRWAVGLDGWMVKQRDFDRLFGFRDYHVVTGHMTLYYQSPWYDLDFRISAGRYLAGDWGATFEAVRTFDSGIQVGGWFTLTNVSASDFGEGSFDKGLIIRIPLEWVTRFATQSYYDLQLRSVQRDGGQRLNDVERLYDLTQSSSYGEVMDQWSSVFR